MIDRVEAFDILCDKIKAEEQFTAELIAQACDGTTTGFNKLEAWIFKQKYCRFVSSRVVTYMALKNFHVLQPGSVTYRETGRRV